MSSADHGSAVSRDPTTTGVTSSWSSAVLIKARVSVTGRVHVNHWTMRTRPDMGIIGDAEQCTVISADVVREH